MKNDLLHQKRTDTIIEKFNSRNYNKSYKIRIPTIIGKGIPVS